MLEYPGWEKPENIKKLPKWYKIYIKWMKKIDEHNNWCKKFAYKKTKNKDARILLCGIEYKRVTKIEKKYVPKMFDLLNEYKQLHPEEFEDKK